MFLIFSAVFWQFKINILIYYPWPYETNSALRVQSKNSESFQLKNIIIGDRNGVGGRGFFLRPLFLAINAKNFFRSFI